MARVYVFEDEAGDFTFERKQGASRYFIVGTATMGDCGLGERLLALRRELMWQGTVLEQFHATADRQRTRDEVFKLIAASDIRVDATVVDKAKTQDHLRADYPSFYREALYLRFKHLIPAVADRRDDLAVVASSLRIKKMRAALAESVHDVVARVARTRRHISAFHQTSTDPCLRVADYVTWAIQRRHESADERSYELIRHLIKSEFEPFRFGPITYY
ncbi:MAG: DUF3800 domain-containing protein [Egibacteraceae bacterium]